MDAERTEVVACTLNGANLKTQRERWVDLVRNFATERSATDDGVRLTFADDPAVATELRALVEAENDCCSWATWSVERGEDGVLVMAARSPGEGAAALQGMFAVARDR